MTVPGVRGMDALQDRDLAGDAMDRDAEAVDVEGDAARRSVRLARRARADARLSSAACAEIGQRQSHLAADHGVVIQAAHRPGGTWVCCAAKSRMRSRSASAASQTALPATDVPVLAKAPVS